MSRAETIIALSSDFTLEEGLESLAILSKLLDTLVELIEGHLFLEECPAELWLVIDERNFGDGFSLGGCKWINVIIRPGRSG